MKDPLQPINLRENARLGIEHIGKNVDRSRGCRPYFRFNLVKPPVHCQHEGGDTPHTVGRFLHAIHVCADIVGLPQDDELLDGLKKLTLDSINVDDGFAWDDLGYGNDPPSAGMHNQREALLALLAIGNVLHDERAQKLARALVASIASVTQTTGTYPQTQKGPYGWRGAEHFPTTTTGRMIGALLDYHRILGDQLGLDLAIRFAQNTLSVCFAENGGLLPAAGYHIHSITGTVASLAQLGIIAGERDFIDRARAIFDNGLLAFRSLSGWVKEGTAAQYGRGEANCTSDLIEAACLLGRAGFVDYFEVAERMLRNHLLASQMDDLSWVQENDGEANTDIRAYDSLRVRAHGAFCFGEPNGFHSYNSDLTGAALQGIAAAWHHLFTSTDVAPNSCRINLLFSRDAHALAFESFLPREGKLVVDARKAVATSMRIPAWVEQQSLRVTVNNSVTQPVIEDGYLDLGDLKAGTHVEVTFDQPRFTTSERILGHVRPHTTRWLGNAVVAMDNPSDHAAFYPGL